MPKQATNTAPTRRSARVAARAKALVTKPAPYRGYPDTPEYSPSSPSFEPYQLPEGCPDGKSLGAKILADMKQSKSDYEGHLERYCASIVTLEELATPGIYVPETDDGLDLDYAKCNSFRALFPAMPDLLVTKPFESEFLEQNPLSNDKNADLVLQYMRFLHLGIDAAQHILLHAPEKLRDVGLIGHLDAYTKVVSVQHNAEEWDQMWDKYRRERARYCIPQNLCYVNRFVRQAVDLLSVQ